MNLKSEHHCLSICLLEKVAKINPVTTSILKSKLRTALLLPALVPCAVLVLHAQAPGADQGTTIQGPATTEVNLIFSVTDKHTGGFVKDLRQNDFGLLDNKRPPARVSGFTQETNLPLRVGLMLDTSSSVRSRFQFEQDSAIEFLLEILHVKDRAFVEGFDVQTFLSQDFTNNPALLTTGIQKLRAGGGTFLFDALYKTCRDQMLPLQSQEATRKAIILISDGEDTLSHTLEAEAIRMCQRAETIVYTISTDTSPTKSAGGDVLTRMAAATGGQAFFPIRIEDLAKGFINIEAELRSQYSLVYRPADFRADGSFHTIYLHALNPRYVVRVRQGYFAVPPPAIKTSAPKK